MDNVVVGKCAKHLANCVGFANVGKKLVTKTCTFRGTFNDSSNVHEGDTRLNDFLGAKNFREVRKPGVRNTDNTGVWLNSCERVIRGKDIVLCQSIKES